METTMGYKMQTTFVEDFMIADRFGESGVRDTYKRAFEEWKDNYVYLTELVIALNWGIWRAYEVGNSTLQDVYHELWAEADLYAQDNLKGEELSFFYRVTD
jgi:hypothetical protein